MNRGQLVGLRAGSPSPSPDDNVLKTENPLTLLGLTWLQFLLVACYQNVSGTGAGCWQARPRRLEVMHC